MMKCASPTANMNVSTELTEKGLELSDSELNGTELGAHALGFGDLGLGALISSKISLWRENARIASSRSASV